MLADSFIKNVTSGSQNGILDLGGHIAYPMTVNNIKSIGKTCMSVDMTSTGVIHSLLNEYIIGYDYKTHPRSKVFKTWFDFIDMNKIGGTKKSYMCTHCKQGPVSFKTSAIEIISSEPQTIKTGPVEIIFGEPLFERRLELDKVVIDKINGFANYIHGFITDIKIANQPIADISACSLDELKELLDSTNIHIDFEERTKIADTFLVNDMPKIISTDCLFCHSPSEFILSMQEIEETIIDFFIEEYMDIINAEIFLSRVGGMPDLKHFSDMSYIDFLLINSKVSACIQEEEKALQDE